MDEREKMREQTNLLRRQEQMFRRETVEKEDNPYNTTEDAVDSSYYDPRDNGNQGS